MEINFETFLQHETGLNTLGPPIHTLSVWEVEKMQSSLLLFSVVAVDRNGIYMRNLHARSQARMSHSLAISLLSPAPLQRWYNQTTALTIAEFSFNLFTAVRARLSREGWKISSTAASHCCCAREWISKPRSGAVGGTLRKKYLQLIHDPLIRCKRWSTIGLTITTSIINQTSSPRHIIIIISSSSQRNYFSFNRFRLLYLLLFSGVQWIGERRRSSRRRSV